MGNPPQSYGTSPAIRAHTVLPATWLKSTCPTLTPAKQAGTELKLSWVAGCISRWLTHSQTITHPSTVITGCTPPPMVDTQTWPPAHLFLFFVSSSNFHFLVTISKLYWQLDIDKSTNRLDSTNHSIIISNWCHSSTSKSWLWPPSYWHWSRQGCQAHGYHPSCILMCDQLV